MKRFKDLVREAGVEPFMPSAGADTLKKKPNKEPMHKQEMKEAKGEAWRVLEPRNVGGHAARHYVVKGQDKKLEMWRSKSGAGDFIKRADAEAKAAELNKGMKEEFESLEEGRPSQRHPLEGHEYHKKTNAELEYIAKDAHKAAEAMKGHNTQAENKYRDQANDSATVRHFRKTSGMPDWYKKKYGHMNEAKDVREYDYEGEMVKSDLRSIIANANRLIDMLGDEDNLPEWCQNKITLAEDYISTVANYMTAEMNEEVEYLEEKNKPTNPELWSRAVSMAKQKFDVYPSAYANGWAAKWYKSKGGSWKSVSEGVDDAIKRIRTEDNDPPFDPPYKKAGQDSKNKAVAGKHGLGYSTVKHLARMALKKQAEKMKPVKESLDESRKTEIVKEIIKKKKNDMNEKDKFEKEPILSDTISKE